MKKKQQQQQQQRRRHQRQEQQQQQRRHNGADGVNIFPSQHIVGKKQPKEQFKTEERGEPFYIFWLQDFPFQKSWQSSKLIIYPPPNSS